MTNDVGAVEVIHDRGPDRHPQWTVGSGYLIGRRKVLTAAHNVDYRNTMGDGERLLVRCLNGQEYVARVVLANGLDGPDLAILEVTDSDFPDEASRVGFAQVDRNSTAPLTGCWAVGFPRFKEKAQRRVSDGGGHTSSERPLRDTAHLYGAILPAANLVSGMLELQVTAVPAPSATDRLGHQHPRGSDPGDGDAESPIARSAWEGMSGAVVFVGGRRHFHALGVVSEHHPPEGASSLNVVPISALNSLHPDIAARWWRELGVTNANDLVRLPQLHPSPRYRERINEIARRTPVLSGREEWLAELARFATGGDSYCWLVGGPWAGKTALTAHLVTNCPPTVDCVAYFLTRRLSDSDSGRFVTVVANQLASLLGDDSPPPPDDSDVLIELWRRAAESAEREDRHLLLVVDGLDEDVSRSLGRPSVAALIPSLVGEHAHVLVTSRRNLELPADVDADSHLRRVRPKELSDSPHAIHIAQAAESELTLLLDRPDELAFDCVAFLAAAEGALSIDDLVELAGYAGHQSRPYRLQRVVEAEIARVVEPIGATVGSRYAFAHDQLRAASEKRLGRDLARYRAHLRHWADQYRNSDWPDATPQYLLDSYPSLLIRHEPAALQTLVEDFGYLDVAISHVGADKVSAIVRTASIVEPSLTELSRCIEQQLHHLRSADHGNNPGYAIWQLCVQLLRLGETELADHARRKLAELRFPRLIPRWSSGRTSAALLRSVLGAAGVVSISANGERALTGGGLNGTPGELLLWDLSGSHPISQPLAGHTTYVAAVALTSDGLHAITGSKADTGGGELFLWDLSGERPTRMPLPHPPWLRAVGISADGRWGITGGSVLVFWPLERAQFRVYNRLHTKHWVHSAALSANGMRTISGGENGELLVWDLSGKEPTSRRLVGHTGGCQAVAINADGSRALTSGGDESGEAGELLLWNLSGKKPRSRTLLEDTGGIKAVAISADGMRALSGRRRDLLLWDLASERPVSQPLVGHTREIEGVAISADNRRAISGSAAELLVWDLTVRKPAADLTHGPSGWVQAIAISGDGKRALTTGGDIYSNTGELLLWDLSGDQPTSKSMPCPDGVVGAVAISANGQRALTGGGHERTRGQLWDLSGTRPNSRPLFGKWVSISADGNRAICSSQDPSSHELWLLDLSGEEPTKELLPGVSSEIDAVALSADGQWAVACGGPPFQERDVLLWDLSGQAPLCRSLGGPTTFVEAVAISSNGRWVVVGGGDRPSGRGELLLWDMSTEKPIGRTLPGPASRIRAVTISLDGHWVISCSSSEVHVHDVVCGSTLRTFTEGQVTCAALAQLTEHELELVIGEWAGTVTAWAVHG